MLSQGVAPPLSSEVTDETVYLHSLRYSFNTYLFSVYHLQGTALGIENKTVNNIDTVFVLLYKSIFVLLRTQSSTNLNSQRERL